MSRLPDPEFAFGWRAARGFWPVGIVRAYSESGRCGEPARVWGYYEDDTCVELALSADGVTPLSPFEIPNPNVFVCAIVATPKPEHGPVVGVIEPERRHPHEPIHLPASGTGVLWCLLAAAACAVFVLCTYLIWSVQ